MPLTRSEAMYFAAGVAVGGALGANWKKIKPLLDGFLGPAGEGFAGAYGDLARMFSERCEEYQDNSAERRHKAKSSRNGKVRKKKKRTHAARHDEHAVNGVFAEILNGNGRDTL